MRDPLLCDREHGLVGEGVLDPRGLSRCSRYEYKIMTRCHYMQSLSLRKDSSSTANIRFRGAACVGVINSSLYYNHYNRGNMHQRKRGLWHFPACQCDSFPNTLLLQSPFPPDTKDPLGCQNRISKTIANQSPMKWKVLNCKWINRNCYLNK